MPMVERREMIVDTEPLEEVCIVIRTRTAYCYAYPFNQTVWESGAKVVTRDGRTVKKVRVEGEGIHGLLDGEEREWDNAGRSEGPYRDTPEDLYILERYFYKDWPQDLRMSNAEWTLRYGRRHPFAKIPK